MASTRVDHPIRGFGLISTLFGSSTLSTADSTYTQAGPTAGGIGAPAAPTGSSAPVRAEVEGTGDQDVAVVVEVLGAGNPGLSGMTAGYRLASESSTQTRGWTNPNVISGCIPFLYGTTLRDSMDAIAMRNGKIFACVRNVAATLPILGFYDPTTAAWSTETAPVATCSQGLALAADTDGHLYVLTQNIIGTGWDLWRSKAPDNTSSGWSLIASNVFVTSPTAAPDKMRLIIMPSGDWAAFEITDSGATLTVTQWASSDNGATFTLVATDTATYEEMGDVVLTPGGKLGIVLIDGTTAKWYAVASPWQSIFTATAVTMATSAVGQVWVATDPNGRMWSWVQTTTTDRILVYSSKDDGATWDNGAYYLTDQNGDNAQYLKGGRGVFAMGEAYLYHQSSDAVGTSDDSPILTRCGGWENAQWIYGSGGFAALTNAGTWLPISEPDDVSVWTADAGNNDARDSFTGTGRLEIITAATTQFWTATTVPANAATAHATVGAEFYVQSGGSVAAFHCGCAARVSNGATASELQVWANTTSFVVRSDAATLATITVAMTAPMQFLIFAQRAGHGAVYYRRPYESTWTLAYSSSALGTVAGVVGWIRWGHQAATTTNSRWSYFWYVAGVATPAGAVNVRSRLVAAVDQLPLYGKPITGLAAPLGVGSQGTSGSRLLHVRAKDGPGVLGETFTITPRYAFPISAIFPTESPSPRATWRSTSTAENAIGFELDATYTTSLTRSIHLTLLNVNFPTAYLEAHNGAGWDTAGTWSGVIGSGLTFTRTAGSNVVRVNGGAALTRYIWANELVGAVVDLGGGKYRRIVRHTEGIWSSAAGKHLEIVLDGIDGTESTGSANLAIWSTRGTLVIHGLATLYRRWRLRIPSGTTVDAFYQIGAFACGPVAAFGQQYSWGWTDVTEPNATRSQSADLVSRVRRRGPARRTWTWAWTQLISQRRLRNATPTPDYLGVAASSEGIANQQDVPYLLQGVLEYCRSGEIPLIALKSISATSGTMITDRTLFMLGRLESSIGIENELGDELAGEAARVSPIALVELP